MDGLPSIIDSLNARTWHSIARTLELQLLQPLGDHNIVIGGGKYDEDNRQRTDSRQMLTIVMPEPPNYEETFTEPSQYLEVDPRFSNLYLYSQFPLGGELDLTLGAAYEAFENNLIDTDLWAPKIGFNWQPRAHLSLRAAYLERVARPREMERTIEPTQVAGFNQLIDDIEGSEIKQFGLGFDIKPGNRLHIGAEFSRRDLQVPRNFGASYDSRDEQQTRAYLYWTATRRLGLHLSYEKEERESSSAQLQSLVTRQLPIGFSYHWPIGAYLSAVGTYVDQEFDGSETIEGEHFWNLDTLVGYRFPKGYGKFEIVAKNILDEEFLYYDLSFHSPDIQLPQFQPERQLFARFTLDF
ncbi:MAG: TonB-dependent receptor [Candidatus Thiodiazotropha sp.]